MKLWKSVLVMTALAALSGCSTVVKGGDASVEINSSKEVQLTNVSVKQRGDEVTVSGTLRPTSSSVRRTGHVDIEFIGEDGAVLKMLRAEQHIRQFSRSSSRKPGFTASVELGSASLSSVRLTHHVDTQKQCEL